MRGVSSSLLRDLADSAGLVVDGWMFAAVDRSDSVADAFGVLVDSWASGLSSPAGLVGSSRVASACGRGMPSLVGGSSMDAPGRRWLMSLVEGVARSVVVAAGDDDVTDSRRDVEFRDSVEVSGVFSDYGQVSRLRGIFVDLDLWEALDAGELDGFGPFDDADGFARVAVGEVSRRLWSEWWEDLATLWSDVSVVWSDLEDEADYRRGSDGWGF